MSYLKSLESNIPTFYSCAALARLEIFRNEDRNRYFFERNLLYSQGNIVVVREVLGNLTSWKKILTLVFPLSRYDVSVVCQVVALREYYIF